MRRVYCVNCGLEGPLRDTKSDAVSAWNRLRYVEETE